MDSPTIQTWTATQYHNKECKLGEGPYYEKATNNLRYIDIIKKNLLTVNLDLPGELENTIIQKLEVRPGVTADIEGLDPQEKILVGTKYGLAVLDRRSLELDYITKFNPDGQDDEKLRANDGAVDPHGRFWLGTMSDFEEKEVNGEMKYSLNADEAKGLLFLFDGTKPAQKKNDEKLIFKIPNSVSWSPDGKTMYFTVSNSKKIEAYDYSADDNAISNRRTFYEHKGASEPDGHRVDVDGNLWSAFYGGSNVLKISPSGEVIGEIKLPTKNITCPEFVGTELFITTASMDEGSGTPEEVANSGALYRVDVGVRGLPPHKFKLNRE